MNLLTSFLHRRKSLWWAGLIGFIFLLVGGMLLQVNGPTKWQMKWQIEGKVRANIPIGSTRTQAVDWLRSQHIDFVIVNGQTKSHHGGPIATLARMANRPVDSHVRVSIPALVGIFGGQVTVYLFFDPQDELIAYYFDSVPDAL